MTTFKPGDMVRYLERRPMFDDQPFNIEMNGLTGTVNAVENAANVEVDWDHTFYNGTKVCAGVYPENLELIQSARQLVGPKPKGEGPVFQAPFAYDGDDRITDARGRAVLQVVFEFDAFPGIGTPEWDAWGEYVAAALNAKAGTS